jgi:hypothetical protein
MTLADCTIVTPYCEPAPVAALLLGVTWLKYADYGATETAGNGVLEHVMPLLWGLHAQLAGSVV